MKKNIKKSFILSICTLLILTTITGCKKEEPSTESSDPSYSSIEIGTDNSSENSSETVSDNDLEYSDDEHINNPDEIYVDVFAEYEEPIENEEGEETTEMKYPEDGNGEGTLSMSELNYTPGFSDDNVAVKKYDEAIYVYCRIQPVGTLTYNQNCINLEVLKDGTYTVLKCTPIAKGKTFFEFEVNDNLYYCSISVYDDMTYKARTGAGKCPEVIKE